MAGAVTLSVLEHGACLGYTLISANLRALQVTSYVFDSGILEIVAFLGYGGCLCVTSGGGRPCQ